MRRVIMAELEEYMARPHGVDNNVAKANGWGDGWPACEGDHDPPLKYVLPDHFVHDPVQVRSEIHELVTVLIEATQNTYAYPVRDRATWGYLCRSILDIHGDPIGKPSNHSWGLAVDINSDTNPRQFTFESDLPVAVIPMWWNCGFYWGGWYRGHTPYDPMHFEYIHPKTKVPEHLAKARDYLIGDFMPLRDDKDGKALIYRVQGILDMAETVDIELPGHHNEPNKLALAITRASDDAKHAVEAATKAEDAAKQAAEAAKAARQAAEHPAPIDEKVLEATLERVVRRVLTATKSEADTKAETEQRAAPRQGDGTGG
jgi:hypothetical protein